MTFFQGANNITVNNGVFTAVSTAISHQYLVGRHGGDVVSLLHGHSATAGLLDAAERFDAPKCDEGTRVSMLRGMKHFVQQGNLMSSPAVYWLHGPAGVGKSALAQSLALSLKDEGNHAASFFFSRTAPGRNDGNKLIVTLAYQLAINFPELQPFMAQAILKDPAILTASNKVKMQQLIIDPVKSWGERYRSRVWARWAYKLFGLKKRLHPRLILVDGLDECYDPEVQRDLLLTIGVGAQQLDPVYQGLQQVELVIKNLGDDEDADEQITTFLLNGFAEIRRTHPIRDFLPRPWPLPGQIAPLVAKSSGGFIYPETVIRYIRMPNNRPDRCLDRILGLSDIPDQHRPYEQLDSLYRHIFESIPHENKATVRKIFHFLVVPINLDGLVDITPSLIEKYFHFDVGHVEHVLQDLMCVVALTGHTNPIRVLHASLPDFLLDRSRSGPLSVEIGDAHAVVAGTLPLALDMSYSRYSADLRALPNSSFHPYLGHMMKANFSPQTYHTIIDVNLERQVMTPFSGISAEVSRDIHRRGPALVAYLDGVVFVIGYLLCLTLKNAQITDVQIHISKLWRCLLKNSSFAATLYLRGELILKMMPRFHKWLLSTGHEFQHINTICRYEISEMYIQTHRDILDLYFLLLLSTVGEIGKGLGSSELTTCDPSSQSDMSSNNIVCALLELLVHDLEAHICHKGLILLVVDLLVESLPLAESYSVQNGPLTDHLQSVIDRTRYVSLPPFASAWLQQLAPAVVSYLKRAEAGAPNASEIRDLRKAWMQYLDIETPHYLDLIRATHARR